ncbi:PspC domain-containing protein [uncultured Enterococcus sp.]|uniref:PspC domain-containing protein n=1 Tax=uncultured Enterococcus sp. TaxID=167972 RepID=UPI0025E495BE|nr:PspC domain-containing protein [uncultured Enterococcus sp.]
MKKRLTKSSDNRVVSGVLGGIAEYFGFDPTIVRLIYVVLSLMSTGFPGILLYIALAIIMPNGTTRQTRYGHDNPYYQNNNRSTRKEAEKVEPDQTNDEDWSDF